MRDRGPSRRAWALTALLLLALAGGAALAVRAAESGPRPSFRHARGAPDAAELGPGLHIAGSGACLPLGRALASSFDAGETRVVVHDSIGSTGGVRAVHDGVIEIGLVSRPLHEHERSLGLRVVPFARVPVVFIAHPDVPATGLGRDQIVAAYRGALDRWPAPQHADTELPVNVLLRERGDSGQLAVARALPGFGEAVHDSLARGRFRVLYHDEDLVRAVARIPGALGISDLVQARRAAVRVLEVDGVVPSPDAVRDGTYPFHRDLALVLAPEPSALAARFAAHVRSPAARETIRAAGALPLGPDGVVEP